LATNNVAENAIVYQRAVLGVGISGADGRRKKWSGRIRRKPGGVKMGAENGKPSCLNGHGGVGL